MTTSATPAAPPLRLLALGDAEHELDSTRRILDAIPDDKLGFAVHERSFTLGELATHITTIPFWGLSMLTADHFDLATLPADRNKAAESKAALLARWDEIGGGFRAALARAGDEALGQTWTLRRGDQVIMAMPRAAAIRAMVINHLVHHRGQLSVYLRLAGGKVPGLYGPSGDELRG